MYKLFVLDRNTRYHLTVFKQVIIDWQFSLLIFDAQRGIPKQILSCHFIKICVVYHKSKLTIAAFRKWSLILVLNRLTMD